MVLRSLDPGQRSAGSTLEYRGSNVSWQHVLECGGSNLGWHRARSFHPLDSNSPCRSFPHKIFPGSSRFPLHMGQCFTWDNVFSICAAKCATFLDSIVVSLFTNRETAMLSKPFHLKMFLSLALLWWWKSPANCKTWQQRDYCCKREFQKVANPGELRCQWYHSGGSCDLGNGQS